MTLILPPALERGPLSGIVAISATLSHPVWREIEPVSEAVGRDARGGFLPTEFDEPAAMDVSFLRLLWRIRQRTEGVPLRIISAARDPFGSTGATKSAHKKRPCRAVDVQVANNLERFLVVRAAILEGIVRIGVYPANEAGRGSIHLDAETSSDNPSPRIWTRY